MTEYDPEVLADLKRGLDISKVEVRPLDEVFNDEMLAEGRAKSNRIRTLLTKLLRQS